MNIKINAKTPWKDCPPGGRLLRPEEVIERTGLSRSQVYSMIADGTFPPFLKVSTRASALPESWLDCFVNERAQAALNASQCKPAAWKG